MQKFLGLDSDRPNQSINNDEVGDDEAYVHDSASSRSQFLSFGRSGREVDDSERDLVSVPSKGKAKAKSTSKATTQVGVLRPVQDDFDRDDGGAMSLCVCTRQRTLGMLVGIVAIIAVVVVFESGLIGSGAGGATGSGGASDAPVDCVVGPWVDAPEGCTDTCGGTKTQTRTVITPEANGGKQCPVLWQNVPCGSSTCPQDCLVSAWSAWSACNRPCGGGSQSHTRTVTTPAQNGGHACPALSESQACNTAACPVHNCQCNQVPSCAQACVNQANGCHGGCSHDKHKRSRNKCNDNCNSEQGQCEAKTIQC
jgi:hypothetical protein